MDLLGMIQLLRNRFELEADQKLRVELLYKGLADIGLIVCKTKPIKYHKMFYANLVNASEWWFSETELVTPRNCLESLPDLYYLPDGTITSEYIRPEAKEINYKEKVLSYVRDWILDTWTEEYLEECLY